LSIAFNILYNECTLFLLSEENKYLFKQLTERDESLIIIHADLTVSHEIFPPLTKGSSKWTRFEGHFPHHAGKSTESRIQRELCRKILTHRNVDDHMDQHHTHSRYVDLLVCFYQPAFQ
jgi:hypothetical protein